MLNKSLARLSRCFDGLTRVLVSSRTVSHSVQSKVTRTMLLLSHVCMLFCPASVTYARSLRYVVAGAHDGIGLGIGKTKSRVCIRNTAVRVRLRGVCDNRGLPNILLKWVCPTLASTLYILQNDAVQQLSVLLLITESSRASQRFRAWSSTGLSGGGVVGGGARGQQRFRVGMVSACSQRLLP